MIIKLIIITPKAKNILRDDKIRVLLEKKPYYLKNNLELDLNKSISTNYKTHNDRKLISMKNSKNYNKKNYQAHNLNRSLTVNHASNALLNEFKEEWKSYKGKYLDIESMHDIKFIGKGGINYIYSYKKELVIRKPINFLHDNHISKSTYLQIELQEKIENFGGNTNIAKIIDFDTKHTLTFMDFYESDLLKFFNSKTLSYQELLAIFLKCNSILKDIHSAGFVHRDVKPENFLLLKNNYIYDIDKLKDDIYIADFDMIKKYSYDETYKLDGFTMSFINYKLIEYNHRTGNISVHDIFNETVSYMMLEKLDISALALSILYKIYDKDYHTIRTINECIRIQNRLFMELSDDYDKIRKVENIFVRIWNYIKNWFRNNYIVREEKAKLELFEKLNDILNN